MRSSFRTTCAVIVLRNHAERVGFLLSHRERHIQPSVSLPCYARVLLQQAANVAFSLAEIRDPI
ncbi:MAG: hypothetical protein ACRD8A_17090 [Candidatus Acidiferrales bacterium]